MNNLTNFDKEFSEIPRLLPSQMLKYCKNYFEKNLFYLYGNKLEMTIIIDAQSILSDAYSYVKNKKSFLLTLMHSPFLKICAPEWLQNELDKKIPEFSKKMKIDENKFREAVLLLKEKINFIRLENEVAYNHALSIVGQRDKKDVPYVALYFSIKSQGILTKDKHMTEIPEIRKWKRPGIVGNIISIFEKGAFSFLITVRGLPKVFICLCNIFITLLRSVWEVIKTVANAMSTLIKRGINGISKFPDWTKLLLLVSGIVLLIYDKTRTFIINVLNSFMQGVIDILKWFYNALRNILIILAPLIKSGIMILTFLFGKIEETITTYNQINLIGVKYA